MILLSASLERIRTVIVGGHDQLGRLIAARIAELIRARAAAGKPAVLGLAGAGALRRSGVGMWGGRGIGGIRWLVFDRVFPVDFCTGHP